MLTLNSYLLLGGGGFLGANLSRALVAANASVTVFEREGADLSKLDGIRDRISLVQGDLADTRTIARLLEDGGIANVVHLVSGLLPSSVYSQYDVELRDVVRPSCALFQQCARMGVRVVFFSSGGAIYGPNHGERVAEGHVLEPLSYYGLSKVQLEEFIRFEHRRNGLPFLILRPSNPFGRFQRLDGSQGLVAVALGRILRGEGIDIWGDGSVVRDYLDVEDMMWTVVSLLGSGAENTIFNIGSGTGASVMDIVGMLESALGKKAQLRFLPSRSVDVKSAILDVQKLQNAVDFRPPPLESRIRRFAESMRFANEQ